MPANAGIHVFLTCGKDVDGRDIGERSDAVLRTAMPGHDISVTFHSGHRGGRRCRTSRLHQMKYAPNASPRPILTSWTTSSSFGMLVPPLRGDGRGSTD